MKKGSHWETYSSIFHLTSAYFRDGDLLDCPFYPSDRQLGHPSYRGDGGVGLTMLPRNKVVF